MSLYPKVIFDPLAQGRPPRRQESGTGANRSLNKGEATSVATGPGMTLRVTRGQVWLTRDGDRTDYVLSAGEAMKLEANGYVVVYGLTKSSIQITTPARAPGVWSGFFARLSWMGEQS
jgi:hypothetical protein